MENVKPDSKRKILLLIVWARGTAILDTMQDMILHLAGSLVTLIPLTVLFFRRRETINRFSFTPFSRRKKSSKKADRSDSENEENIEE